ncbi:MAG: ribosome assembly RNA-binding protein YhbY [Burkholderiaceae bacterium]
MAELTLTSRERQALKGRAHPLKPVVLLGAGGLTDSVLREIDRALTDHQLVKIKVADDDRDKRAQIFSEVSAQLSAVRIQSIGKTIVLFRPAPESDEKQEPHGSTGGARRLRRARPGAKRKD